MEPTTAQDWIIVAEQRLADARAILKERPDSVGSVYMAGYAIECALKGLLQKRGIASPKRGQEGHDLMGLLKTSGLRMSEINDPKGIKTFFIQEWTTDWRYETSLPNGGMELSELVEGAAQLLGWIKLQIRPRRRRK